MKLYAYSKNIRSKAIVQLLPYHKITLETKPLVAME